MGVELRKDGKPFVTDNRGSVPRFSIEDNEDGIAILINQFTCEFETIGERPLVEYDPRLKRAYLSLSKRERLS